MSFNGEHAIQKSNVYVEETMDDEEDILTAFLRQDKIEDSKIVYT